MEGALAHAKPQSHTTCAVSQVWLLEVSDMQEAAADTPLQQAGLSTHWTLIEPSPFLSRSPRSCAGSSGD